MNKHEAIVEVKAQLAPHLAVFRFEGSKNWKTISSIHPITKEQVEAKFRFTVAEFEIVDSTVEKAVPGKTLLTVTMIKKLVFPSIVVNTGTEDEMFAEFDKFIESNADFEPVSEETEYEYTEAPVYESDQGVRDLLANVEDEIAESVKENTYTICCDEGGAKISPEQQAEMFVEVDLSEAAVDKFIDNLVDRIVPKTDDDDDEYFPAQASDDINDLLEDPVSTRLAESEVAVEFTEDTDKPVMETLKELQERYAAPVDAEDLKTVVEHDVGTHEPVDTADGIKLERLATKRRANDPLNEF